MYSKEDLKKVEAALLQKKATKAIRKSADTNGENQSSELSAFMSTQPI